jgi:hypothetical protein
MMSSAPLPGAMNLRFYRVAILGGTEGYHDLRIFNTKSCGFQMFSALLAFLVFGDVWAMIWGVPMS